MTGTKFGDELPAQGGRELDLICIGRGIADLYADQLGGRLEDAISFSAYVGGSALNICVGVARLGLETAMVLRVGDDHMGRLVRETMARNGVRTEGVITDPKAPTPLCILGVRDRQTFPRDLFTANGAYLNLAESDLDPTMFQRARAVLINGSFFATEALRATSRHALALARQHGCATVLDVDYRPALWGLVGHGSGEQAYVESRSVTESFAEFLPQFDVIVGTEEEIAIAGGVADSLGAVRAIRAISGATIVLKRGPTGCVAFQDDIPDDVELGEVVPGFPVEVMNTAGAGDSFMAGFAAGWLRGLSLWESCRLANACGAINVARHGCSDSAPSLAEVEVFMAGGITRPDADLRMRHLHAQLGRQDKATPRRIARLEGEGFSAKASEAWKAGAIDGIICPPSESFADLADFTGKGLWIARRLATGNGIAGGVRAMAALRHWPREHILCLAVQGLADIETVQALAEAASETRHEIAVDISECSERELIVQSLLDAGVAPEWWLVRDACASISATLAGLPVPPRGIIDMTTVQV